MEIQDHHMNQNVASQHHHPSITIHVDGASHHQVLQLAPQKKPLHKTTDMSIKPLGLKATARELIVSLMTARPELRKESNAESMRSLGCMLQGLTGENLALLPYDAMLS